MKKAEAWRSADVECECPYCSEIAIVGTVGDALDSYTCEGCNKEFEIGEVNE